MNEQFRRSFETHNWVPAISRYMVGAPHQFLSICRFHFSSSIILKFNCRVTTNISKSMVSTYFHGVKWPTSLQLALPPLFRMSWLQECFLAGLVLGLNKKGVWNNDMVGGRLTKKKRLFYTWVRAVHSTIERPRDAQHIFGRPRGAQHPSCPKFEWLDKIGWIIKKVKITFMAFNVPFNIQVWGLRLERDNWVIGEGGLIFDRVERPYTVQL